MIQRVYRIVDEEGLHARPAAAFVKHISPFPGRVEVLFKDKRANGKSILQILALGVSKGQELNITYESDDLDAVVLIESELAALIELL